MLAYRIDGRRHDEYVNVRPFVAPGRRVRILNAEDVRAALPMPEAIEAMRDAFLALSRDDVEMPRRTVLNAPTTVGGTLLVMPAALARPASLGAKLVTVLPGNPGRGLPLVGATVLLLDPETGRPAGLLDGTVLTALRTGAASGLATDLLARSDARSLAIFGTGAQARTQLEAVCAVRSIERIWVVSRSRDHAERFAREVAEAGRVTGVEAAASPREAVAAADIICAATSSPTPVFDAADLRPGTHINAVGSFTREMREVDPGLLPRARVVVDQREAAIHEAGEVMACLESGTLTASGLIELGTVVAGEAAGRERPEQITVFKSVGLAVQDIVAGARVLAAAARLGLGTVVSMSRLRAV